jgi:hypothetical protein
MNFALASLAVLPFLGAGCAAVSSGANQSGTPESGSNRNIDSLMIGGRTMFDSDDWDPVEDQVMGQIGYAVTPSDWPVGIEVSASYSGNSDSGITGETVEGSVGLRKTWDISDAKLHPYLGAGLALIRAEYSGFGLSDNDSSLAGYAHGGAYYDITEHWQVGGDLRVLFGSGITLFGIDGDADYLQVGVFVGYAF